MADTGKNQTVSMDPQSSKVTGLTSRAGSPIYPSSITTILA